MQLTASGFSSSSALALALGHQQVDVVAADEVVGQADDGALQAGLAVVVCCVC